MSQPSWWRKLRTGLAVSWLKLKGSGTVLDQRRDLVGHIEALRLDGEWHYFGFSTPDELVLSPLFKDQQRMAQYAATRLFSERGEQPEGYWLAEAQSARQSSRLVSTDAERTFHSSALHQFYLNLQRVIQEERPQAELVLSPLLLYWLNATLGWIPVQQQLWILEELETSPGWRCHSDLLNLMLPYLRGERPLPPDAQLSALAIFFLTLLEELVLNGAWVSEFGTLVDADYALEQMEG